MKKTFLILIALPFSLICDGRLMAEEAITTRAEEDDFVYEVGKMDLFTGEGVNVAGYLFPSVYSIGTGGIFEPGAGAGDFATSEHDPANEWGIQGIEPHLDLNIEEILVGHIAGFIHQGEDHEWEAELEEAFLHWNLNELVALGGGRFLNRIGFQQDLHIHDWDFVNQNLTNGRFFNEGELIIEGGEILLRTPGHGLLTLGVGEVRSHAHGDGHENEHEDAHGHEDEHGHEEHHEEGEDPGHFDAHEAAFESALVSADYRFRFPFDDSFTGGLSVTGGENGFGLDTYLYTAGIRKVWNGHDHGQGPDFCTGALMWQSEFFAREAEVLTESGAPVKFDDHGISNSLHYGISERITASVRHDWVSEVANSDLSDRQRFSTALSALVDPAQRVRARIQYDYTTDDLIGSEHAAWLQVQIQWGGTPGSHAGHGH